jgi:hypothetical protein
MVQVAERFADGRADEDELTAAWRPLSQHIRWGLEYAPWHVTFRPAARAAQVVSVLLLRTRGAFADLSVDASGPEAELYLGAPERWTDEVRRHCLATLRDIFGNPFRPVAFSPDWRTDTAVSLARAMYESREFGAMPILADALQDAGCDNDDILSHCRGAGPHVRGCWVVDLVLGKQ